MSSSHDVPSASNVNRDTATLLPQSALAPTINSREMLDFENEMFLDILNTDGLVIAAKGLGLEDVFLSLLKVYSDPGNLVIVLGATGYEERYYVERMAAENVSPLPKIISSESGTAQDRIGMYLQGGVMFMPARILVVDLLKERVPTPHVTGILVYRAHSVLASCQEAFALRLYRQKNKTGFVKAFSSSPQAFTAGFSQVSRIMKILFVKKLLLWPRFQATVQATLNACTPTVIEMHVQLTSEMTKIQNAVLDLMNLTVKEIKRINPTLDVEQLTVENAIAKSFHKILQFQLDPVWHQLSGKTKTLVADLKLLRVFLHYLTRYDCVTFEKFVSSFRTREYAMNSSGWLLLDAANTLYEAAHRRVVGGAKDSRHTAKSAVRKSAMADKKAKEAAAKKKAAAEKKQAAQARSRKKRKAAGDLKVESPVKFTKLSQEVEEEKEAEAVETKDEEEVDDVLEMEEVEEEEVVELNDEEEVREEPGESEKGKSKICGEPEPSPKWLVLRKVLSEIKDMSAASEDLAVPDRVLILVEDKLTAKQLQDYLVQGSRAMMRSLRDRQRAAKLSSRYKRRTAPGTNACSPTKLYQRHQPQSETREVMLSSQLLASQGAEDDGEEGENVEVSEGTKETSKDSTKEVEEKEVKETSKDSTKKEEAKDGNEKMADEEYKDVYILSQKLMEKGDDVNYQVFAEKIDDLDISSECVDPSPAFHPPIVIIQTVKSSGNPLSLPQTLNDTRPRFIVLYDVDVAAIRRIEVYQNALPEVKVHVYVIVFGGSVEEQAYLTSLRREKEAFDALIREKATMVVPEDQDGKTDSCTELDRTTDKPGDTVNSRHGSTNVGPKAKQTVIVDMREFNSELPAMIHRRGIEIEPLTLQVGDYILSPEICVERKSISDLIGSLNNGRLYNQAKAMTRYYARPILLIEADQNKPLTLMGNYYISNDMSTSDVQARLILLTLHFPQLKIFWSPSPHATAQLFEELKQFREEPDAFKAVGIGADLDQDLDVNEKYNPGVYDFLARLPGVTSKNIRGVVTHAKSLDHLVTYTKEALVSLLGSTREAECLFNGLHRAYSTQDESAGHKKQKIWKGKKFGGPRKR